AGGQQSFDRQTTSLPRSLGVRGGLSLSYSLSPRTNIGINIDESRTKNQFQRGDSTNASFFLGRKMGLRWFVTVNGGMAYNRASSQGYGTPPSRQAIGSGTIGYRAKAHTFIGSYMRSSSDAYGVAVGLNTSASGAWSWHRPGSGWTLHSSFGQHQIRNAGYTSFSGWRANTGFSPTLSDQFLPQCRYH